MPRRYRSRSYQLRRAVTLERRGSAPRARLSSRRSNYSFDCQAASRRDAHFAPPIANYHSREYAGDAFSRAMHSLIHDS